MVFPEERVDDVCNLTPLGALELMEKGQAGDADSLAAWSVYAIHSHLLKLGASKFAARHHTKRLVSSIEIDVVIRS